MNFLINKKAPYTNKIPSTEPTAIIDIFNALFDSTNAKDCPLGMDAFNTPLELFNKRNNITSIDVLPYMTYVNNKYKDDVTKETGKIIVPDGSGAVIDFNIKKANASGVNNVYYGKERYQHYRRGRAERGSRRRRD